MIRGANDARAMGGHGVGSPKKQVQTPRRRAPTLVALSSCGGPVTARCRPPLGTETLRAARAGLPAQGLELTITSHPHWPQGISCCGYSLHVLSGVVSTPSCPPRFSGRPILRSNPHPIQLASDLCGIIPMSAAGDRVTVLPTVFAASSVVRRVSAPAAAAAERSVPGTSPDGNGGDSTGGTIEVKSSSSNVFGPVRVGIVKLWRQTVFARAQRHQMRGKTKCLQAAAVAKSLLSNDTCLVGRSTRDPGVGVRHSTSRWRRATLRTSLWWVAAGRRSARGTLVDGPRYGHPEPAICRRRERSAVANGFPNVGKPAA